MKKKKELKGRQDDQDYENMEVNDERILRKILLLLAYISRCLFKVGSFAEIGGICIIDSEGMDAPA